MSVIVLKKRFEAPPSKEEIYSLLVEENLGDKAKAKDALVNILAPMKDLLALYGFMDSLDSVTTKYSDLLKEQDAVNVEMVSLRAKLLANKSDYDNTTIAQTIKIKELDGKIIELESSLDSLTAKIETEEQAKARIAKITSDEYDKLQTDMIKKVADNEKLATRELGVIQSKTKALSEEYNKLKLKMLQRVAEEEKSSLKVLDEIQAKIKAGQKGLDDLEEKKRKFIASLG